MLFRSNDTATTEIYTLSLHDALPISVPGLSSRILMVRPDLIGYGTELQFEVHPIGGRSNPISETITVHPGDVIHLTIPPT